MHLNSWKPYLERQQRATGLGQVNLHASRCGRQCEKKENQIGFQQYTAFFNKQVNSQEVTFTPTIQTLIRSCSRFLSEPHRKSSRTTSDIYPNSGLFINYVCTHGSSTLPPSLTLKDSVHRGNKNEILDFIVPVNLSHALRTIAVLAGAVLIRIFCLGSAVPVSQMSLFRFTPKRQ